MRYHYQVISKITNSVILESRTNVPAGWNSYETAEYMGDLMLRGMNYDPRFYYVGIATTFERSMSQAQYYSHISQ